MFFDRCYLYILDTYNLLHLCTIIHHHFFYKSSFRYTFLLFSEFCRFSYICAQTFIFYACFVKGCVTWVNLRDLFFYIVYCVHGEINRRYRIILYNFHLNIFKIHYIRIGNFRWFHLTVNPRHALYLHIRLYFFSLSLSLPVHCLSHTYIHTLPQRKCMSD